MKMKEQSSFNLRGEQGRGRIRAANEQRVLLKQALTTLIIPWPGKLRIQFQLQAIIAQVLISILRQTIGGNDGELNKGRRASEWERSWWRGASHTGLGVSLRGYEEEQGRGR